MGDLDLLERMRRTCSGWGEDDMDRLYRSFGFREITRSRAPHRVYVHPDYPESTGHCRTKEIFAQGLCDHSRAPH